MSQVRKAVSDPKLELFRVQGVNVAAGAMEIKLDISKKSFESSL